MEYVSIYNRKLKEIEAKLAESEIFIKTNTKIDVPK